MHFTPAMGEKWTTDLLQISVLFDCEGTKDQISNCFSAKRLGNNHFKSAIARLLDYRALNRAGLEIIKANAKNFKMYS